MSDFGFPSQPSLFSRTLRDCRELYVTSAQLCVTEHPQLLEEFEGDFIQLMDDLHGALVLKVYMTVCEADRQWSKQEQFLAEVMCHHLWDEWLSGDQLRETIQRASQESTKIKWYSVIRPFDRIAPLRERIGELETLVVRLANLVARADGVMHDREAAAIRSMQSELHAHLNTISLDEEEDHKTSDKKSSQAIEEMNAQAPSIFESKPLPTVEKREHAPTPARVTKTNAANQAADSITPEVTVDSALAELDELIGLSGIKEEVRSLANFLKMQQKREALGLPETELTLHMVFTGNPGTGKTTVARIVGKIFKALGVLAKGHLIETDRSGLVAEYAGQTGPKTQKKIDEALDGLLFIDEAYSLVAMESEDPYGHECVQTLLKRAEDDRERLIVILAGYPVEMLLLLRSNPGLSSRFNRQLEFPDYTPLELARIFGLMCGKNRYKLSCDVRLKIMIGFDHEYRNRDRHFGNGRAARNVFENAIRRMANRLATIPEITEEQLVTFESDDIEFAKVPMEAFELLKDPNTKVQISCLKCQHTKAVKKDYLTKEVTCPKCKTKFQPEWGEVLLPQADSSNSEAATPAEDPSI